MSVDLSSPDISRTYDEIIKYEGKDWLLLSYSGTRDRLSLLNSGEGDFEDLCQCVRESPEDVYFGFCRERDNDKNYFALITFVPTTVAGVRRARALVHSRAVGSLFKVANVSINVSDLDSVNMDTLRARLHLPPTLIPRLAKKKSSHPVQRSASMPVATLLPQDTLSRVDHLHHNPAVMRASASEDQGRMSTLSSSSAHMSHIPSIADEDDLPPPPIPPKDPQKVYPRSKSMAVAYSSPPTFGHVQRKEVPSEMSYSRAERSYTPPRVPRSPPRTLSPEERAKLRLELQQRRKEEERVAREEEARRQVALKQQKEDELRREREEEEYRLARIEEQKRHALAERARREQEMLLEEERKEREAEIKREQDRARRYEQTRRFEEERQELERRSAENARKKEEQRLLDQSRRKQRMREIQEQFSKSRLNDPPNAILLTGTVTIQTSLSLAWKRRFFELTDNSILFYRDSVDRANPLDIMSLSDKRVSAIKEPYEGYDELETIPHSFAVEFSDDESPWSMFSDSEDDKDVFVSLLSQICGL